MTEHMDDPGETPARERGGDHPTGQAAAGPQTPTPRHKDPVPAYRWRLVWTMILGAILVLLALITLALYGNDRNEQAKASDQTLGDLASQVQAACKANPVDARKVFGDVCGAAKTISDRPAGEKGDPGATGPRGAQGPQGVPGAQGPRGVAGPVGPTGTAGASPGCLILVTQCRGPEGPAGIQGLTGPPGAAGADGSPGLAGAAGKDGQDGADGEQGPKGDQGQQGIPGPAGPPCVPGSSLQKQQVLTSEAPVAGVWILACVLDDQNP